MIIVIPLAKRSGLIEWCEGTRPLGAWLVGDERRLGLSVEDGVARGSGNMGAHLRYRPDDMIPASAKKMLVSVRDKPIDKKLFVFKEICEKLKYACLERNYF
ncbi:unnamed protein product [Protopolystoma xenopodis]|uniref:Uncharacterized protein n=1 Tax=Protopolystoma xenopodis TaxID=117903 RepID=A0A448XQA5_9PLAT|nr:unnamed protein product [Protopolystoma xenopodis]